MANYKDIDEARKMLGLSKVAKLKDIRSTYRRLAKLHHPDKQYGTSEKETEKIKHLNRAYKILVDYCENYHYSFREEDIARTYPYEEYARKWREKWFNSI